jgi:putative addiction module component (TIGR02574 family)
MSREPAEILKEALALPVETRAALADSLLESLDGEIDPGAYEEWEREIQRRIAEVEAGTAKTIPWCEARARLMSHLRNDR